jgi:hypothetical protein
MRSLAILLFVIFAGCQSKPEVSKPEVSKPTRSLSTLSRNEILENREFIPKFGKNLKLLKIEIPTYSKRTFRTVQNLTQKMMDKYIDPRKVKISFVPSNQIPPEIKKPKLPELPKLVKGRFETTPQFQRRVQKEKERIYKETVALQEKYRKKVEARNSIILKVQKQISFLKKFQQKEIQQVRVLQEYKKSRKDRLVLFTEKAFFKTVGNFKFVSKDYDADSKIYQGEVSATNSNYKKRVSFKSNPQEAQNLWKSSISPKLDFSFENGKVSLENISVANKKVKLIDKIVSSKPIQVTLKREKTLQTEKGLELPAKIQSPNLKEKYRISTIGGEEKVVQFSDDLKSMLAKSPKAKKDKRKWAFVVGIENYEDTADVPFSKRSSEMFGEVAEKVLGVPKRNIYTFIDSKATTTKIRQNLRRMLENVKSGDTIYFYYSGHGVPSNDGEAYILPQDQMVDYVHEEESLKLENIYKTLTDSQAKKVIAFVDSCFSGKTGADESETLFKGKGTAGIYSKDIEIEFDKKKMAVITAGGTNDFSNMFEEKGHRMFSYYLMKDILNGEKKIENIYSSVRTKVRETSNEKGDKYRQTPQLEGNLKLGL